MTTFKTLTIKKLNNGYEELFYEDKKFLKKFVRTDEWWNLESLPVNHDRFELQSYINQLEVYSEEHRNPPVVEFLIGIRPVKLQLTPYYQTHEDHSKVLHLDEIIFILRKIMYNIQLEHNCHGFMYFSSLICKTVKKAKSRRRKTNIPRGMRHEVFKRDGYRCVECGASKYDGATLHVDHKIPVSKGGTDELSNLQTLCSECNLNKSDVIQ
jgi:hypothetical protein